MASTYHDGSRALDADYLVVGAGAAGLAFADALTAHADVRVALVDRRHGPGGHWLDAYPFVRLHQASAFYGVASTELGTGAVQQEGPEAGLHERAAAAEICAYYQRLLETRLLPAGRVEFLPACEYLGGGALVSRVSGARRQARPGCRIVDARYVAPEIPATTPPPFAVADGARVVPVHELPRLESAPSEFVVVGAGKTATDTCIWLLQHGVDPEGIVWVRPREPWMLNRAVVQPDPAVFAGMGADTMEAAIASSTPDELFLRLEAAGIMVRIDEALVPTMAKAPTLARWELDLLRSIERVVRLGHVRAVESGRIVLDRGDVAVAPDAIVVHCAAAGLQYPPLRAIWDERAITLQPVRAGFPCLGAALIGYVEATRDEDVEKNRVCRPSPLGNTPSDWAGMQAIGGRAAMAFGAEPDIKAWVNEVALNPARVPAARAPEPAVRAALGRMAGVMEDGIEAMERLAGVRG
ncbi:NAD(P)-binding protein [Paraconexibacter sp.]|uniref:NAD(P)-binding protein n=1 Tax=Paraconexibacter sp. TaxID=2949640 RepID=UPI003561EB1F